MGSNKTSLERAFELAETGDCENVSHILRRLKTEGYAVHQIVGRTLKKQLAALIAKAADDKSANL